MVSRKLVESYLSDRLTQSRVLRQWHQQRLCSWSNVFYHNTGRCVSHVLKDHLKTEVRGYGGVYHGLWSALLVGNSKAILKRGINIISGKFFTNFSSTGFVTNPEKSEVISSQSQRTWTHLGAQK